MITSRNRRAVGLKWGLQRTCEGALLKPAMRMSLLLGLLIVLSGVGCEPCRHYNRLQVAAFTGGAVTKKPYGTVKPFSTAADVKRPYEVIGLMSCEASAGDEAAVLNAMLYRAADLGADGIILNPPKIGAEDVTGSRVDVRLGADAWILGNGNQRAYRAQAIKFKG